MLLPKPLLAIQPSVQQVFSIFARGSQASGLPNISTFSLGFYSSSSSSSSSSSYNSVTNPVSHAIRSITDARFFLFEHELATMQIEMDEEGAPPTPAMLEGSLSSTILDLDHHPHPHPHPNPNPLSHAHPHPLALAHPHAHPHAHNHNHNFGSSSSSQYATPRDNPMEEGTGLGPGQSQQQGVAPPEDDDGMDPEGKDRSDKEGMARKRRAEIWQDAEMDALVRAFREVHMKLTSAAGTGKKVKQVFKSANDKWQEVRTLLLASGVDRQPKEIERKWSNLSTAFKQIADWNSKKGGGRPSYWELDEGLKKEKTKAKELPATFRVQLFDAMAEFMGERHGQGGGLARSRSPAQGQQGPQQQQQQQQQQQGLVVMASSSSPVQQQQQQQLVAVPGLPRPPSAPGVIDVPLPMEKLAMVDPSNHKRRRVVILAPGSFNPPTYMHLRMFELGMDALTAEGYHVLGAYMSPVNDLYHKKGLAPAEHRIRMCELAVADSPFIMVDSWEAKQSSYQRTLTVLARIDMMVNFHNYVSEGEKVRVMLLCGTDLLESIVTPGVWIPDQVRTLLQDYGIVCINRDGKDARRLVFEHDLLYNNRRQILVVDEVIQNNISATAIRRNLSRDLSVKYLLPDSVISHIKLHRLYMNVPPLQQP